MFLKNTRHFTSALNLKKHRQTPRKTKAIDIFVLNSACEHNLNEDRSLFKKAFDCINRNLLAHKVLKEGMDGKIFGRSNDCTQQPEPVSG